MKYIITTISALLMASSVQAESHEFVTDCNVSMSKVNKQSEWAIVNLVSAFLHSLVASDVAQKCVNIGFAQQLVNRLTNLGAETATTEIEPVEVNEYKLSPEMERLLSDYSKSQKNIDKRAYFSKERMSREVAAILEKNKEEIRRIVQDNDLTVK